MHALPSFVAPFLHRGSPFPVCGNATQQNTQGVGRSSYHRIRKRAAFAFALTLACFLDGCRSPAPAPKAIAEPPDRGASPVIARNATDLRAGKDTIDGVANSPGKTLSELVRNVRIEGDDVLLPEREKDAFPGGTEYSFYVFAHSPSGEPISDLIKSGALKIDVIGAEYTLSFPIVTASRPSSDPTNPDTIATNGSVAKLTFTPTANRPLRPFTILAWFPARYNGGDGSGADAWSARRDVKVYYGDIRTRVQVVSQTEAAAMFGRTFAQNFFVGRVFLRNRSDTKSLAVYTTSMRVPVLFYRKSAIAGGLRPEQMAALEDSAREYYLAYKKQEEQPAAGHDHPKEDEKKLTAANAEQIVRAFRVAFPAPAQPVRKNDNMPAPVVATDAELVARVLALWAQASLQPKNDPDKLSPDQLDALLRSASAATFTDKNELSHPGLPGKPASPEALIEHALGTIGNKQAQAEALRAVDMLHTRMLIARDDARFDASDTATRLATALSLPPVPQAAGQADAAASRYTQLHAAFARLPLPTSKSDAPVQSLAGLAAWQRDVDSLIEKVANDGDRARFEATRKAAVPLASRILEDQALANAISGQPVASDLRGAVTRKLAQFQEEVKRKSSGTPFNELPSVPVNLSNAPLALSKNSLRQMRLLENGYIWREAYRPMTFQSVLNGIMASHDNDRVTQRVVLLETLARVAGGAVGLSNVVGEFGRSGYLQTTNFFTSVFTPSLRSLLVEDLRKFITNLGDTAMDTVVIIRPHESVDRYVFFPRGAIYNFPDEFDVTTPAYISGIEGDDLFVEALPINPDEVVKGGAIDSSTLVARALNEGEKTEQARLFDIAQTQSKLKTVELGNLVTQIDALFAKLPADNAQARMIAQSEALHRVANFQAYFGPDQSGSVAVALAKYGLSANDTAPTVGSVLPITLPAGTVSTPQPLPITDVETPLADLKIDRKTPDGEKEWLEKAEVKSAASGVTITVETKPNATLKEETRNKIEYKVTDVAGHTTPFAVPVVLRPWAPAFQLFQPDTQISTQVDSKNLDPVDLKNAKPLERKIYRLDVTAALNQADSANLKIDVKSQEVDGKATTLAKAGGTSSSGDPKVLKAGITFDTSAIADPSGAALPKFTLVVVIKRGDVELCTQSLTWEVNRKP